MLQVKKKEKKKNCFFWKLFFQVEISSKNLLGFMIHLFIYDDIYEKQFNHKVIFLNLKIPEVNQQ